MMRWFAVTASSGEAADSSDGMPEGQAGRERIAGAEWWHVVLAHIPGCGDKCREQASGEDSSRLKCGDAEDLAGMGRVIAPLVNDVENFRAENTAEDDQDSEVPSFVAVIAEALGVADANPKPEQDAQGDKESVGREEEASEVKELWEH